MATSQRELARQLSVSQMTVSRALRGASGLSGALRQRIVAAAHEAGYPVRRLHRRGDSLLYVVASAVRLGEGVAEETFNRRLLHGMQLGAAEQSSELHNCGMELEEWPQLVQRRQVDGMVCVNGGEPNTGRVLPCPVPLVALFCPLGESDAVTADGLAGGRLLGEHLGALGHRRVAYLGPETPLARERLAGVRQGLEPGGGGVPGELALLDLWAGGLPSVARLVARLLGPEPVTAAALRERFTALAVYNDYMAIEAIRLLRARGLRVPEDLSVTGFDGVAFPDFLAVQPTTVIMPIEELGAEAVSLLYWRIQRPAVPRRRLVLDVSFQAGATTGPANQ